MHSVLISLASNYEQEKNLSEARKALAQILFSPVYTPAIWTEPYGKKDSNLYLNQLVSAQTDLDSNELNNRLKETEKARGRDDEARRQGIVPIDLDLLQHDECRFHQRDWQRSYVQQLLLQLPTSDFRKKGERLAD